MKPATLRPLALLMSVLMTVQPTFATCGGGGGGGMGGMRGGNGDSTQTYAVPWKFLTPDSPKPTEGLVLYWFPASQQELRQSSLRVSRQLSLYASQCVTLEVADVRSIPGQRFVTPETQLPIAVIATPDHQLVSKLDNTKGKLNVEDVEKMLDTEMKSREKNLDQQLQQAKEKSKSGDNAAAIEALKSVYSQKCLFSKKAKEAAKELKRLGVEVADIHLFPVPNHDAALSHRIEQLMSQGLAAENASRYEAARDAYLAAGRNDPADPTPLRYLGETYRHHLGQWDKARATFDQILAMPADPMSRAVALHGLGKMTIHEGDFKKGLHLMEQSVAEYPLALAYRNLAVYWNSGGDHAKAAAYTDLALEVDPQDPFNLIFVAAFKAGSADHNAQNEALAIAREHESDLPASYNLAAIYAQAGQRDKALALLQRHFYQYERYAQVRSKEMMEARVDAVFASLRADKEFLALTHNADGRLPMPMSPKAAMRAAGGSR